MPGLRGGGHRLGRGSFRGQSKTYRDALAFGLEDVRGHMLEVNHHSRHIGLELADANPANRFPSPLDRQPKSKTCALSGPKHMVYVRVDPRYSHPLERICPQGPDILQISEEQKDLVCSPWPADGIVRRDAQFCLWRGFNAWGWSARCSSSFGFQGIPRLAA